MQLVSKISSKAVMGQIGPIPKGGVEPLYKIFGVARGSETRPSNFDKDTTVFSGDFGAERIKDGETFRANKCYLPTVAENMLFEALTKSEGSVEFAFEIGAKYALKRDGSESYEYVITPLIELSDADILKQMQGRIVGQGTTAALPAPKQEVKKKK